MFQWLKERKQKRKQKYLLERYKNIYARDPALPIRFGRKTRWIAVQANSAESVCNFLNISLNQSCNWIEGRVQACESGVFITPSLNGWVLLHTSNHRSFSQKSNNTTFKLLKKLSIQFGNAQFYGNMSSSSYAEWTKFENGEMIRHYSIADVQGEEIGEPTQIEKQWKLINPYGMPAMSDEEYDSFTYPSFEEIAIVSENWSINPITIEDMTNVSTKGYYCSYQALVDF